MPLAARLLLAALLVVPVAGCTTTRAEDDVEDEGINAATEDQIRTRIAGFATMRGNEMQENVEVLGGVMRAYSVPYLLEALESSSDDKVRGGCAMALGMAQDGRAVDPLHRMMTKEREEGMRYTAAYNLCLFRDSRGIPPLLEALRSTNSRYRFMGNQRLVEVTGLDFGFGATDPPSKRNAAADRWDAWYREVGPEGAGLRLLSSRRNATP